MVAEIFEPWSDREIQKYQEIRKKELTPVYIMKEILSGDPVSRTKYLIYLLEKFGYDFENDIVNSLAEQKDKAEALVHLEKLVLIEF